MKIINIVPVSGRSDTELSKDGWQKQTTLDGGRLHEVAEGYRTLGYEVFVQEFQVGEGCTTCFGSNSELGRVQGTVWTRPGAGARKDNELFD